MMLTFAEFTGTLELSDNARFSVHHFVIIVSAQNALLSVTVSDI